MPRRASPNTCRCHCRRAPVQQPAFVLCPLALSLRSFSVCLFYDGLEDLQASEHRLCIMMITFILLFFLSVCCFFIFFYLSMSLFLSLISATFLLRRFHDFCSLCFLFYMVDFLSFSLDSPLFAIHFRIIASCKPFLYISMYHGTTLCLHDCYDLHCIVYKAKQSFDCRHLIWQMIYSLAKSNYELSCKLRSCLLSNTGS